MSRSKVEYNRHHPPADRRSKYKDHDETNKHFSDSYENFRQRNNYIMYIHLVSIMLTVRGKIEKLSKNAID